MAPSVGRLTAGNLLLYSEHPHLEFCICGGCHVRSFLFIVPSWTARARPGSAIAAIASYSYRPWGGFKGFPLFAILATPCATVPLTETTLSDREEGVSAT